MLAQMSKTSVGSNLDGKLNCTHLKRSSRPRSAHGTLSTAAELFTASRQSLPAARQNDAPLLSSLPRNTTAACDELAGSRSTLCGRTALGALLAAEALAALEHLGVTKAALGEPIDHQLQQQVEHLAQRRG